MLELDGMGGRRGGWLGDLHAIDGDIVHPKFEAHRLRSSLLSGEVKFGAVPAGAWEWNLGGDLAAGRQPSTTSHRPTTLERVTRRDLDLGQGRGGIEDRTPGN